ncbi:transporter substrate-binding domain-containing protein [Nocardioidaceae bacterium]|nr:transporter substrate-binding domain-containing protein [Nocardioidaceae bacterium]
MRTRARLLSAALVPLVATTVLGCAPVEEESPATGTGSSSTASSSAPEATCTPQQLGTITPGTLTVGTDSPAYEPWFADNDPTNGEGFESAVAYAVAEELGYARGEVEWVTVPFNNSYAPGPKRFDFDINQISITPARAEVVDFSEPYYVASQGLIALEDSPVADATSIEDLQEFTLGAQTGTTSLTAIREQVQPSTDPLVFEDTNSAKQALLNGQVDAVVADLPTAFYITAVEIPRATIVGQFEDEANADAFGMLFEKGSTLVPCVDEALATLEQDGTLDDIEQQWLSDVVDVPVLD